MNFLKKMKDILFDEEETIEQTPASNPVVERKVEEKVETKPYQVEQVKIEKEEPIRTTPISEKEAFKVDNTFDFPDFDEDEFESNINAPVQRSSFSNRNNIQSDFDRKKVPEKRADYSRIETPETKDKRKFKPSPIISPVYGVLNEDYQIEDIKNRGDVTNVDIDVDSVRKKAFGDFQVDKTESLEQTTELNIPVQEEIVEEEVNEEIKKEKVKTIDELLEDTVDVKINVDSEVNEEFEEVVNTPELEIEETTTYFDMESDENLQEKETAEVDSDIEDNDFEDTFKGELIDLIDSMYENKEEGEF